MQDDLFADTDLGITSTAPDVVADVEAAVPNALYRFWASDGTLLYIGITLKPNARWKQHMKDKPWWSEVAGITVEQYPTREAVEAAEREAIRTQGPKYNVTHNTHPAAAPFPAVADLDRRAAENAADYFRFRAGLKSPTGPLNPEQASWVADMLDIVAATAAPPAKPDVVVVEGPPSNSDRIRTSGRETWIAAAPHDFHWISLMTDLRVVQGTGPGRSWTDGDTERLRGEQVIIVAARAEPYWSEAERIANAIESTVRSLQIVRPAKGPDLPSHMSVGLGLAGLVPVSRPLRWEKSGLPEFMKDNVL